MESVESDRPIVMELVYGTVRRWRTLTWVLRKAVEGKAEKAAEPFLLIGIYQILFMSDMAEYAAVNETVEASKKKLSKHGAGFVNAVLRRVLRGKQAILSELKAESVAIRESHPDVLVDKWRERLTPGKTVRLCKWNNSPADVIICVNTTRLEIEKYQSMLKERGIEATPHAFVPQRCLVLPRGIAVPDLPGYADGLFTVQDPSMLTPVRFLALQRSDHVLDACAAPGGKAMLIAQKLGPEGELVAMDLHEDRLVQLRENFSRMKLTNVKTLAGDASDPVKVLGDMRFDRILADVPCTNTGVLRRRPDARWRFTRERLKSMVSTQRAILDGLAPFLNSGGTLVYSTCSIEWEEGSELIAEWIKVHKEFRLDRELSLFPPETQTDGIYAARLVKR